MYEITLVWPELLSGRDDWQTALDQPELQDEAWWAWQFETELLSYLRENGCTALFAITTEGLAEKDIEWTTPAALLAAVDRLSELVQQDSQEAATALSEYQRWLELEGRSGAVLANFLADLRGLRSIAEWAASRGKTPVTWQINV